MVFANYLLGERSKQYIGDNIQIYAIDELYNSMGIQNVTYIETTELGTYDGDYAVLPVTMPLVDYVEGGIAKRFSPRIIPVFLGLTMVKDTLSGEEVDYLRKYEPIGCRDEYALQTVRKYGIKSYLNGCITITLPKRTIDCRKPEKTYIVDVAEELMGLIPSSIKEEAVYRTHHTLFKTREGDAKQYAIELLNEYKNNASLVITSLLHCAIPCIAFGIPVIILKNEVISYRFSWVEAIAPIYTRRDIDAINWHPEVIEIEDIKRLVFENAKKQVLAAFDSCKTPYTISLFYENRKRSEYSNDACLSIKRYIDTNWDINGQYKYAFWGMTQVSEWIYEYIRQRYPNARLCHIYDAYKSIEYMGIESVSPNYIEDNKNEIVFVTAWGAINSAIELFDRIDKKKDTYAIVEIIK